VRIAGRVHSGLDFFEWASGCLSLLVVGQANGGVFFDNGALVLVLVFC